MISAWWLLALVPVGVVVIRDRLSPAQLEVVREIVKAHARLLVKWANS